MSAAGFQNILLVTDGSPASQIAQQTAMNLALAGGGEIKVVDTARPPLFGLSLVQSKRRGSI